MEQSSQTEFTIKREIAKTQIVVETKLPCQDSPTKVLGTDCTLSTQVSECLNGEVRLSGKQSITMVYDTENGASSSATAIEYSERVECDVSPSTKAFCTARVLDTDIVGLDGSGVKLASVIEIVIYEIKGYDMPSCQVPDGVFGNERHIKCSSIVSHFAVMANLECEEMVKADSILCSHCRVVVKSADAGIDSALVTGDVYLDICYMSQSGVSSNMISFPFSEEVGAVGARINDIVRAGVQVTAVNLVESADGFGFNVNVNICGEVYCTMGSDILEDCFCPSCELESNVTDVSLPHIRSVDYVSGSVEGGVQLDAGDSADNILCVCGTEYVCENAYCSYGKVQIDGVITGNIIYYDADSGERKAVSIMLPTQVVSSVACEEGDKISAFGSVANMQVKIRRSGEIYLRADVRLCVTVQENLTSSAITSVSLTDAPHAKQGSISVYIAGAGDSAYECAKKLNVSPSEIVAQNENIIFPTAIGQKIIVHRD